MTETKYPPVLVIGAGELGLAMLKALRARSQFQDISVLLRPSSSATDTVKALGINIVAGDYARDSAESLASTFSKFHTIVGCSGYVHGASGLQTKICRAVLDAGVKRYIPWQFGVDYDVLGKGSSQNLFDEQLEVRAMLRRQSATSWILVMVGVFMSFLLSNDAFGVVDRKDRVVRGLGSWDTSITTTDADDIGTVTAAILLETPEIKDQVCHVAGQTLTYNDLAEVFVRRGYKKELWSRAQLDAELAADPDNGLKKYRPIFASEEGIAWSEADSWNGKKGIKTKTIADVLDA